jgi:anti-anti-sigma factor
VLGLHIRHHHAPSDASVVVVEIVGEIDIYTSRQMRTYLVDLVNRGFVKLVLDFSEVMFLDSSGLSILVHVDKRTRHGGGSVVLTGLRQREFRILRIVELDRTLWIRTDVATATALFADMTAVLRRPHRLDDPTTRWPWLTCKIYLADADIHEAAEAALAEVIKSFGLQVNLAFQPVEASWFREFLLKVRGHGQATLPVEAQLDKLVRTIEMQALHRPQAEIDAAQGDAVAKLITALDKTPRAVVQVGSVLVVKVDEVLVVRNLTQLELAHWERNPALFRDPKAALEELQRAATQIDGRDPPPAVPA